MVDSLKKQAVKGVVWSAVERFSVQGIQFVLSIVIARLVAPSEYGLIQKAEEVVWEKGGKSISLHAQCRVRAFYEKLGFCGYGVEDEDEGCPHCWMKKQLSL